MTTNKTKSEQKLVRRDSRVSEPSINSIKKMDPCELRMNLASLQRIDPYIAGILMSSPQVSSASNQSEIVTFWIEDISMMSFFHVAKYFWSQMISQW